MKKKIKKVMKIIILLYIVYFVIGSGLIFAFYKEVSEEYKENSDYRDYYSDKVGPDRAIILDNPLESGLARLFIIENAKESLDIAYFSIERGETPNVFLGALFDAADRGVQVNILLDGLFHGLRGSRRPVIYGISNHPNIHLKFYEKFNPLKPWTLNNRMHDKYVLADKSVAILGGRNIGDKYFAPEWYKKSVTNDRDVVIINYGEGEEAKLSAVNQISDYFDEIWNHKYSKDVNLITGSIFRKKADKMVDSMKEKAEIARQMYKEQFDAAPDFYSVSQPTNKITFIHNPIERFSKEPWVWYELVELSKAAKESVFVQSPYIVPSKKMTKGFISPAELEGKNITFLTNSLGSTPNLPAFAGYQNYRKKIVDLGIQVLEIQSVNSIHSKALVIDREITAIGSFNLDPRSAFLSTESMVIIHSEEVVEAFGANIHGYTDESLLVSKDYKYHPSEKVEELNAGWLKRLAINALSLLARLFDYLL